MTIVSIFCQDFLQGYVCEDCYISMEKVERKKHEPLKRAMDERTFVTPDKKRVNTASTPQHTSVTPEKKQVSKPKSPVKANQLFPPEHKQTKIFKDAKVMNIASNIKDSKYTAAFNKILSRGPAAQRAFDKMVEKRVSKQIKAYSKAENIKFPQANDCESFEALDINDIINDAEEHMPTFHAALSGALMPKKYHPKQEKRRR